LGSRAVETRGLDGVGVGGVGRHPDDVETTMVLSPLRPACSAAAGGKVVIPDCELL